MQLWQLWLAKNIQREKSPCLLQLQQCNTFQHNEQKNWDARSFDQHHPLLPMRDHLCLNKNVIVQRPDRETWRRRILITIATSFFVVIGVLVVLVVVFVVVVVVVVVDRNTWQCRISITISTSFLIGVVVIIVAVLIVNVDRDPWQSSISITIATNFFIVAPLAHPLKSNPVAVHWGQGWKQSKARGKNLWRTAFLFSSVFIQAGQTLTI